MATIMAFRQMAGIFVLAIDRLKRRQRYWRAVGPRWRRWRMLRLSGPRAVEEPESLMARWTSCGVKGVKVGSRVLFLIWRLSLRWARSRRGGTTCEEAAEGVGYFFLGV